MSKRRLQMIIKNLVMLILSISLCASAFAYEGSPQEQVDGFFKDLSAEKTNDTIDIPYSSNPAMSQKIQHRTIPKQQMVANTDFNVSEILGKDCLLIVRIDSPGHTAEFEVISKISSKSISDLKEMDIYNTSILWYAITPNAGQCYLNYVKQGKREGTWVYIPTQRRVVRQIASTQASLLLTDLPITLKAFADSLFELIKNDVVYLGNTSISVLQKKFEKVDSKIFLPHSLEHYWPLLE
jgi:hypothetical protein